MLLFALRAYDASSSFPFSSDPPDNHYSLIASNAHSLVLLLSLVQDAISDAAVLLFDGHEAAGSAPVVIGTRTCRGELLPPAPAWLPDAWDTSVGEEHVNGEEEERYDCLRRCA